MRAVLIVMHAAVNDANKLYFLFATCSYTVIHRTEVVHNTVSPVWNPFSLKGRLLCNGDYDRSIKIDCYHHRSNGK